MKKTQNNPNYDFEKLKQDPNYAISVIRKAGITCFLTEQLMEIAADNNDFALWLIKEYPLYINKTQKIQLGKHFNVAYYLLTNYKKLKIDPIELSNIIFKIHYRYFAPTNFENSINDQFLSDLFSEINADPKKIDKLNVDPDFFKNYKIACLYIDTSRSYSSSILLEKFSQQIRVELIKNFDKLLADTYFFDNSIDKLCAYVIFNRIEEHNNIPHSYPAFKLWSQVKASDLLFNLKAPKKYFLPSVGTQSALFFYFHFLVEFHKLNLETVTDKVIYDIFFKFIEDIFVFAKNTNNNNTLGLCKEQIADIQTILQFLIPYHEQTRKVIWINFAKLQTILDNNIKQTLLKYTNMENELEILKQYFLTQVMSKVKVHTNNLLQKFSKEEEAKLGEEIYKKIKGDVNDPVALFYLIEFTFIFLLTNKTNETYNNYICAIPSNIQTPSSYIGFSKVPSKEIIDHRTIGVAKSLLVCAVKEFDADTKTALKDLENLIEKSLILKYQRSYSTIIANSYKTAKESLEILKNKIEKQTAEIESIDDVMKEMGLT